MCIEFLIPIVMTYLFGLVSLLTGIVVVSISPAIWCPTILISCCVSIASFILPSYYYPNRMCNTCGEQLLLPWGADHLWCAIRHHSLQSALGWCYIILYYLSRIFLVKEAGNFLKKEEALKARIREESIAKSLRET
jgi:hypothetical protein